MTGASVRRPRIAALRAAATAARTNASGLSKGLIASEPAAGHRPARRRSRVVPGYVEDRGLFQCAAAGAWHTAAVQACCGWGCVNVRRRMGMTSGRLGAISENGHRIWETKAGNRRLMLVLQMWPAKDAKGPKTPWQNDKFATRRGEPRARHPRSPCFPRQAMLLGRGPIEGGVKRGARPSSGATDGVPPSAGGETPTL